MNGGSARRRRFLAGALGAPCVGLAHTLVRAWESKHLLALLTGAALLAATDAPAHGATFGPDLNSAIANYPYSCDPLYVLHAPYGCTLMYPTDDDIALLLPDPIINGDQTGVVTALHVLAAESAPAQFIAVEWASKINEAAPFPTGVTAVTEQVTLHPGINNFITDLPVDRRLTPDDFESWSVVSLNILNGTSRIPAQEGGSYALGFLLDNGLPLTETAADLNVPPHNLSLGGAPPGRLLMSGEVTITTPGEVPIAPIAPTAPAVPVVNPQPPAQAPPIVPVVPAVAAPVPRLAIPAAAKVKGNAARLPLRCVGAANCAGSLRIQNRLAPGSKLARAAAEPKLITYASGSFSIPAGKTRSVTVKLSKAGKLAIKGHRSLKAYANVAFKGGRAVSLRVTLKR